MYRRLLHPLLLSAALLGGCQNLSPQPGFVFFKYSLWQDNGDGTFSDTGCINASVAAIRVDLFFKGVNVGNAESVCGAFGNGDGVNTTDELGKFLAEFEPTTFDQLQISAIGDGGSLMFFGLRLNDADRAPAEQQSVDFANPIELSANQRLIISLPGEPGSQIDNELQMIIIP